MRTIEGRFNIIRKKKPYLADYPCLAEAVAGQNFSRKRIGMAFRKLVDKDDYEVEVANSLITQLYQLSKVSEEGRFETKIESSEVETSKRTSVLQLENLGVQIAKTTL